MGIEFSKNINNIFLCEGEKNYEIDYVLILGGLHALLSLIAHIFRTLLCMNIKFDANEYRMINEKLKFFDFSVDLTVEIDVTEIYRCDLGIIEHY